MRKGQTTTIIISGNTDLTPFSNVVLTLRDYHTVRELQNEVDVPAKSISGNAAYFDLSQEDTLGLRPGTLFMQVRAADSTHTSAITSNVIITELEPALNNKII